MNILRACKLNANAKDISKRDNMYHYATFSDCKGLTSGIVAKVLGH